MQNNINVTLTYFCPETIRLISGKIPIATPDKSHHTTAPDQIATQ